MICLEYLERKSRNESFEKRRVLTSLQGVTEAHNSTCALVPQDMVVYRRSGDIQNLSRSTLTSAQGTTEGTQLIGLNIYQHIIWCMTDSLQTYKLASHQVPYACAMVWFRKWPRIVMEFDNIVGSGPNDLESGLSSLLLILLHSGGSHHQKTTVSQPKSYIMRWFSHCYEKA